MAREYRRAGRAHGWFVAPQDGDGRHREATSLERRRRVWVGRPEAKRGRRQTGGLWGLISAGVGGAGGGSILA